VQRGKIITTVQGEWVKIPQKALGSGVDSDGDKITQVRFSRDTLCLAKFSREAGFDPFISFETCGPEPVLPVPADTLIGSLNSRPAIFEDRSPGCRPART
jgi:hypothetical protein